MPNIARLYDFQEGDTIDPTEVDNEYNQLVETVNDLPDKDGTIQTSLNADLLDDYHASIVGGTGTIPVCNGDLQVDLNAEFVGGLAASDLADAGFPAGTRMVFAQAAVPAGWTIASAPAVDRVLGWASGAGTGGTNNGQTSWGNLGTYYGVYTLGHILTVDEIPAHTHTVAYVLGSGGGLTGLEVIGVGTGTGSTATVTTGGGNDHDHTAGLQDGASSSTLYRPPIHWIVIGTKN
jgi:hypothetical protein